MAITQIFNRKIGVDDIALGFGSYTYVDYSGTVRTIPQLNVSYLPFADGSGLTPNALIDGAYALTIKVAAVLVNAGPTLDNHLTRKLYVDTLDAANVKLTGDQTVAGIKTFTSFPVTPSSNPSSDYQVANRKFVMDNIGSLSKNYYSQIVMANNVSTPNTKLDITVAAVVMADVSNGLLFADTISKTLDVSGNGAGKLDTGSFTAVNWYYIHVIGKTDGTTNVLASLSSTSPTMPTGYTYWKLIGAVYATTGPRFYSIVQYNDVVQYKEAVSAWTAQHSGFAAKTIPVPPIAVWADFSVFDISASALHLMGAVAWDASSTNWLPINMVYSDSLAGYYASAYLAYTLNPANPQVVYVYGHSASYDYFTSSIKSYRIKI